MAHTEHPTRSEIAKADAKEEKAEVARKAALEKELDDLQKAKEKAEADLAEAAAKSVEAKTAELKRVTALQTKAIEEHAKLAKVGQSDTDRKAAALKDASQNDLQTALRAKNVAILNACSADELEAELTQRGVAV